MINTLRRLHDHPIAGQNYWRTLKRFAGWHLGSRLLDVPHLLAYTDHAQLLVKRGDYSASNQYLCGLSEYREMAFACHFLTADDLFVDVGANIGAYSILLAAFVGCHALAIEPNGGTYADLQRNIALNQLQQLIDARQFAAADRPRELLMTQDWGNANQVWDDVHPDGSAVVPDALKSVQTIRVSGVALDDLALRRTPALLKIDVEGFEFQVLAGAKALLANPALEALIIEDMVQGHGAEHALPISQTIQNAGFFAVHYDPKQRALRPANAADQTGDNVIYVRDLECARQRVAASPALHVLGCVI